MSDLIGIVWFEDELAYCRALEMFADCRDMPATYEDWKAIVGRQLEEIKRVGNIAIRADFDPETFVAWCTSRGFPPGSHARTALANHAVLEYQKTGKGTIIE